jgi:hypothetical protein
MFHSVVFGSKLLQISTKEEKYSSPTTPKFIHKPQSIYLYKKQRSGQLDVIISFYSDTGEENLQKDKSTCFIILSWSSMILL